MGVDSLLNLFPTCRVGGKELADLWVHLGSLLHGYRELTRRARDQYPDSLCEK